MSNERVYKHPGKQTQGTWNDESVNQVPMLNPSLPIEANYDLMWARVVTAEQRIRQLERVLRKELWMNHGHDGLYGDDGQMQCNQCPLWDYQNTDVDALVRQVAAVRLAALAEKP